MMYIWLFIYNYIYIDNNELNMFVFKLVYT